MCLLKYIFYYHLRSVWIIKIFTKCCFGFIHIDYILSKCHFDGFFLIVDEMRHVFPTLICDADTLVIH